MTDCQIQILSSGPAREGHRPSDQIARFSRRALPPWPPITSGARPAASASGIVSAKSRAVIKTSWPSCLNSFVSGRKNGTCGELARSIQIRMTMVGERLRMDSNRPPGKLSHCAGNVHQLFAGELRIHRERQHLSRKAFGVWQVAGFVSQIKIGALQMHRNRIVNPRGDSGGLKVIAHLVAFLREQRKNVIDRLAVCGF